MITLIVCSTFSNHNYDNLKSYKNIVDSVLLYDTGMTMKEVEIVKEIFNDISFTHLEKVFNDFSQMRNNAIYYAKKIYKPKWIIMPDESWEIINLSREVLKKCRASSIITNLIVEDQHYHVERIFRNAEFIGEVNEVIKTTGEKMFYDATFIDTKVDPVRSLYNRNRLVNWKNDRQSYYQRELYRRVINDEIKKLKKIN